MLCTVDIGEAGGAGRRFAIAHVASGMCAPPDVGHARVVLQGREEESLRRGRQRLLAHGEELTPLEVVDVAHRQVWARDTEHAENAGPRTFQYLGEVGGVHLVHV